MRQWRNGAGNAPRHYSGTRSAADRALSRTRSLTAAAVAVAMMATVAVTSLIPAYNAKADENTLKNGSKCTPTSYTLGDASGIAGEDTGVATYVGRDLYVGKNTSNKTSINNEGDVDGSYAVEAEGLTVVNGKLVMKPLKDSWKAGSTSAGFRWGTVGFGSQFRPGDGKTVLAIGGTDSGIDTLTSGGVQGNVGAYVKGGFVGQSYAQWQGNQPAGSPWGYKYKASIAGDETKWSSDTRRSSIVARQGDWTNPANGDVTFNASNPLKNVNDTDYSAYGTYIQKKLSEPLSKIQDTSTGITTSVAPKGSIDRYKYNYNDGNTVSYRFIYDDTSTTVDGSNNVTNNEKLITFTGDGVSAMQVFNIEGTALSSAGYRGVDFKFVNIPDNASIVINVSGNNIDFHTGWRFWWNDIDIGGGFSKQASEEIRGLYSSVAQKIMWNFKDARNVTIRGGVANESKSENDGNHLSKNTTDDPAATMLGSILVPNGSFESHVSTNGRVYVGQDFMMYNPTAIKYEKNDAGWEGKTASVLNMDQERHNLPWNGQMIANCPAIQWNKANSAGEALKGTTWKVYGTLEAAETGTSSLGTITDGEFTDGNDEDGVIKFEGIAKNAKYFVKEFATNSTEYTKVNPYIYQINTGDDENTHKEIVHVFNAEGNEITGTNADKKLTDSDQIINEKEGAALEWSKVDGTDTNKILSGSEWQLQKNDSNEAYRITDSTKAVHAVTIQYDGVAAPPTGIPLTYNVPVNLTAIVTDTDNGTDGVPQAVKWTSSDPTVASVNNGTVLGLKNGSAKITACSVADNTQCATANITVTGAPSGSSAGGGSTTTGSVTISGDTHEVELNKTITLTATPTPSSDTVTWYSGNASVASVTAGPDTTTTIKGLKAGTTTITAKTSSGATASTTITVKDDSKVGVYFKKSAVNGQWSNYYLHYQKTADYWLAVKMDNACNDKYVVAYIPKTDAHKGFGFLFRDSTNIGSGSWYGSNGENVPGGNFTFVNEGVGIHIESNSDKGEGVSSGCQATQSSAKMKARVSTAVLRSDKTGTVAINDMDDSVAAQGDDSTGSSTTSGADTTVYSCSDVLGKCDMNTEPGKFRVVDLADGTYTLTETVAPNGYTAGGSYTVTITDGMATITDASGNTIADNKIPNARNTGAISWNKVSSDPANDNKLGGSEWKLTKTESFGWNTNGVAQYTAIDKTQRSPVTITDCKSETGKTCSAPAEGQKIYDVDPVEGQFKLTGLKWGTYTLVESKAPDGYDVDSTVRTFTFGPVSGSDGTGKWNSNGVKPATDAATGKFATSNVDYDSSVFTFAVGSIKNQPGVILPATGGEGLNKMYAAGLLAVTVAVAGLALSLRRRRL